jgi:hypothetical protein
VRRACRAPCRCVPRARPQLRRQPDGGELEGVDERQRRGARQAAGQKVHGCRRRGRRGSTAVRAASAWP